MPEMSKREIMKRRKHLSRLEPLVKQFIRMFQATTTSVPTNAEELDVALATFHENVSSARLNGDRLYAQAYLAFKQLLVQQLRTKNKS